jgi:diguanylate cyclase (GGDEF)-like protein
MTVSNLNLNREELQNVLTHLEQALFNHIQWHKRIVRDLVCHLPVNKHDIAPKAHQECLFGQWYYQDSPKKLQKYPGFVAIGEAHEHMHQLVASLLTAMSTRGVVESQEYDIFANAIERLQLEIASLKRELELSLHSRDPLTEATSRVDMLPMLRETHALVKRGSQVSCIAMMDLDLFKKINDKFGHSAGDNVLITIVHFVTKNLRVYDKLFRYGGEEFLICMQHIGLEECYKRIEQLREEISKLAIDMDHKKPVYVTASFGLTLLDPNASIEECIDRADKAMYAAKSSGRNCTKVWEPSLTKNHAH